MSSVWVKCNFNDGDLNHIFEILFKYTYEIEKKEIEQEIGTLVCYTYLGMI